LTGEKYLEPFVWGGFSLDAHDGIHTGTDGRTMALLLHVRQHAHKAAVRAFHKTSGSPAASAGLGRRRAGIAPWCAMAPRAAFSTEATDAAAAALRMVLSGKKDKVYSLYIQSY
jgi:hypothetical protein